MKKVLVMHHDYRVSDSGDIKTGLANETVALLSPANQPASSDHPGQQPRTEMAILLQFTHAVAKITAEQRGDAAVVAVTQCLFQLLQPAAFLHAHLAPENKPGQTGSIQIDDWLEKLKRPAAPHLEFPAELQSAAVEAVQRCVESRQCQWSAVIANHQILAVPLSVPGHKPQSLAMAVRAESSSIAWPILTTFGGVLSSLQLDGQVQQGQNLSRQFQSLVKNHSDLASAKSLAQAATHLTTRWAEQLPATHVAWVVVRNQKATRVAAISGATEIDPASRVYFELIQATQALLQAGGTSGRWVAGQPAPPKFLQRQGNETPVHNSPAERCMQSIVSELMVPAVVAIPVRSADQIVAYLFLSGAKEIASPDWEASRRNSLDQIQTQTVLATRVHQTAWQRWMETPSNFVRRWRRWMAVAALSLGGVAAFPMPYMMYCNCELVTTDRRYAVAPYKGTLKDVFVTPGQVVSPGHLLATMDDRELRIEVAGKQAAFDREQNQIKVSRAAGDFAKARISELEAARINSEVTLLNHHLSNREIRSPIAGTIVQGDLAELSGAPVEVGSNLFEVAGLDEMLVQIEIPEYQYRYSTVGQEVGLHLEAFPYETYVGVIERLHPRATTRDTRNVFLAEIRIPNPAGQLRPGMKGQARVRGDAYPLAWKWLHHPYEKTRQFLGWF
jgi:hypothetical protein